MKKKRSIKIVDILFFAIVFIGTYHTLYTKYYFRMVFIYGIIDTLLQTTLLVIAYITIRIAFMFALRKAYTSKMSAIDLKNDNYYRDVIHKYSPAVLKYIDNFELGDAIIMVILMGLKLKGIINNQLEIINGDLSKLDLNEKYICININKLKNIDMKKLKSIIIHDCKEYGLLEDDKVRKHISGKTFAFFTIVPPTIIIMLGTGNNMLLILAVALAVIMLIVFVIYCTVFDAINYINPYKRTKNGEVLNEKLEGLKKYLEDYSSLENKSDEELALWEDYLIYSVMFNKNEKIIKEYQEKIDRM